ncbi:hypothetical protein N658DRAFT_498731 [Parathielavia hyrcaniae]|uniref:Uncharacterized protein n=1 Tax=Parathielavia hyrcaniae TaxID=113614 RepID=A0AAN6PWA9_9PEZI|nr:hypothetical protein N658DRAFT_498731 [Parathielavia hyrcaniae]
MEDSVTKAKEPSDQVYLEVSQVDDASGGGGQDVEPSPESPSDDPGEPEKQQNARILEGEPVILGTDARLWTSLVHLLPLAVSVFLIASNTQRVYWYAEDGPRLFFEFTAEMFEAVLQLFAKVYELLVIASLTALTLKVFKRRLVDRHLPLGLLTGAYRVGDVRYIFTRFFLRAVLDPGHWTTLLLALLVVGNTFLSTLIGPAAAILLVPELGWHPLRDAFSKVQLPVFFYNLPIHSTWPRVLDASVSSGYGCDSVAGWWKYSCPSGGYVDFTKWLTEWESSALANDFISQDPTGVVRRRLIAAAKETEHNYDIQGLLFSHMAMTTTSMAPLVTIGRLFNFIRWDSMDADHGTKMGAIHDTAKFRLTTRTSSESTIFQPLVQSDCTDYPVDVLSEVSDIRPPYFSYHLNCLGDPWCESRLGIEDATAWLGTKLGDGPGGLNISEWMGTYRLWAPNATDDWEPLLASIILPYRNGGETHAMHYLCTIIAHWMPAALSISPAENDFVNSNVSDFIALDSRMDHFDNLTDLAGPAIKIESEWLDFMMPEVNVETPSGTMKGYRPVGFIIDGLLSEDDTLESFGDIGETQFGTYGSRRRARSYVQKAFTGMVAEALSRVAPKSRSYMVNSYNDTTVVVTDIGNHPGAVQESATWSNGMVVDIQPRDPGFLRIKFNESILSHLGHLRNVPNDLEVVGNFSSPQEYVDHLSTLTHLGFEVETYGYGSGNGGTATIFAITVVSAYLLIVGTYFLYVMVLCKCLLKFDIPTITAWGDVTELVLLAWNSRPHPMLSKTSVAVHWSRWQVTVGIRADQTGRVSLVTTAGYEKLKRNELYH